MIVSLIRACDECHVRYDFQITRDNAHFTLQELASFTCSNCIIEAHRRRLQPDVTARDTLITSLRGNP